MTDIITRICIEKWRHIERRKAAVPIAEVRRAAAAAPPPRGFAAALDAKVNQGGYGLIAEIKKASPSKGLIRDDFDPPSLAHAYQAGGAACLSVLTDTPYFQGADEFLTQARDAVSLPVLRKDFMLDPYQVFEARALGADCILLIMAALQEAEARDLEAQARELGMDVLIEVHNAPELERAMALDSSLIGINNRSLRTMQVDMATTELLCPMVPRGRQVVCESGLRSPADLHRMGEAGAKRFLVGESLMAQKDVEQATRTLLGIER